MCMEKTVFTANPEEIRHSRLLSLIRIALMCSVMCVLCPLAVPAGPIPVTLGVFAVYLAVYALGGVHAAFSCLLYILLGALGLPVFSGYAGGLGKLLGPTGGYLVGYVFLALIAGWFFSRSDKVLFQALGMTFGLAVCYFFGTAWFTLYKSADGMTFGRALTVCVVPFLPFDALKIIAALAIGNTVKLALKKAHQD